MRLRETDFKQRTLCLAVVVLLLAPVAAAARLPVPRMESSPPPVLHAEDLAAGLTASSARATGDLAWHHEDGWFVTQAAKAGRGTLSIVVEGVDVVAFRYDAPRDAAMGIVVDGVTQKWLPAGDAAPFDLPLDGKRHTVAWTVVAAVGDLLGVRVEGAQPIVDPWAISVPTSLLLCSDEDLVIRLGWARALLPEDLLVAIDGAPVEVQEHESKRAWNVVETTLRVPVPPQDEEQATVRVTVGLILDDGTVRQILDQIVDVVAVVSVVWDLPSGWEYDRTPTIGLLSLCAANPVVDVRLVLDGQDETHRMEPSLLGVFYTFDRELEFREEHTYALEAKLRYGASFRFERNFTEGLDVLELDPELGYIEFPGLPGGWAMVAPTNMDTLPPVRATPPPGTSQYLGVKSVTLQSDAHLRAVYAPLALRCDPLLGVCDPYGGMAPGFGLEGFVETTLAVTGLGRTTEYPTLGQTIAASHYSTLDASGLEALVRDTVEDATA